MRRAALALQRLVAMTLALRTLVLAPLAVAVAVACSGTGATGDVTDTSPSVPSDAGADDGAPSVSVDAGVTVPPTPDASLEPAPPSSPPPTAPAVVDAGDVDDGPACTSAGDRRDSIFKVVWFPDTGPSYTPGCMLVRAGASVTFLGDFGQYPMIPMGDGARNPIPVTTSGMSVTVTFYENGRYRYGSPAFPKMRGAIEVVP